MSRWVVGAVALALAVGTAIVATPVDEASSAPPAPAPGRLAFSDASDLIGVAVFRDFPTPLPPSLLLEGARHVGEADILPTESGDFLTLVSTKAIEPSEDGALQVVPDALEDPDGEVWLSWSFDGRRVVQVTDEGDEAHQSHPVIDVVTDECDGPLEVDVAYASDEAGNWDIWLARLSNQGTGTCTQLEVVSRQQLTTDPADDLWPTWALTRDDERRLVFSSTRTDPLGDLFWADVPIGISGPVDDSVVRLTDYPGAETQPAVRPIQSEGDTACAIDPIDGLGRRFEPQWVAYRTTEFDPRGGLAVVGLEPGVQSRLDLGVYEASEPAWDESGRGLAYRSTEFDPDGDVLRGLFQRTCVDADVGVLGTLTPDEGFESDVVELSLTVENDGLLDAQDVVLEVSGTGVVGVAGTLPSGCAASGTTVTCELGTLGAKESRVVDPIPFALGSPGTFELVSDIRTSTRELNTGNNTDRRQGVVLTPEPLVVQVIDGGYAPVLDDSGPYEGDTVFAAVVVTNTGRPDALDLVLEVTSEGGTPTSPVPDACAPRDPDGLLCDLGTLEAEGDTSLDFAFTAGAPGELVIQAVASAQNKGDPVAARLAAPVSPRPELDIEVLRVFAEPVPDPVPGEGTIFVEIDPLSAGVVVVSAATDDDPIRLYPPEFEDCRGALGPIAPCSRPGDVVAFNSTTFGVRVPYSRQGAPEPSEVNVEVRVDPAPPAVDPDPTNNTGTICVGQLCPDIVLRAVAVPLALASATVDALVNAPTILAAPIPGADAGSTAGLVEVDVVSGVFGVAESHPTWGFSEVVLTARPATGDVSDVLSDTGSDRRLLVDLADVGESHPSYSPDGRFVAYARETCDLEDDGECLRFGSEIVIAESDGGNPSVVYGAAPRPDGAVDTRPSWSPDGTSVAFTRIVPLSDNLEPDPVARTSIWAAGGLDLSADPPDLAAADVQQVTTPAAAENFGDINEFDDEATWSPDGSTIAFTRARCDTTGADSDGDGVADAPRDDCGTPPAEPPPPSPPPSPPPTPPPPVPLPAGFPAAGLHDSDIWVVDVDSGDESPLLEFEVAAPPDPEFTSGSGELCGEDDDTVCVGGDDRGPDWSPDGDLIAYEHTGWLWLADPAGSDEGPVTGPRSLTEAPFDADEEPLYPDDPLDGPPSGPDDPAEDFYPALSRAQDPSWSPNGDRIAFAGQPRGQPDLLGIYWLAYVPDDPDAREVREIAQLPQPELEPDWQPTADLAITVAANPATIPVGAQTSITAEVVNEGPATAIDATAEITLPPGLTLGPLPAGCSGPAPIVCGLGDLTDGEAADPIVLSVTGNAAGAQLVTAETGSTTVDPDPLDNEASTTIAVGAVADLEIALTAAPTSIQTGDPASLTADVSNLGPSTAEDAVVEITVPSGLSVGSLPGSCTGGTPVACDLGDLVTGAGGSVTIPVTGTTAGASTVAAETSSQTPDPDLTNNTASVTITVTDPVGDVSVEIAADPNPTYVGVDDDDNPATDGHELTVTTRNAGPDPSTVTLTVSVPDEAGPPVDPCLSAGGCSLGSIPSGGEVVTTIQLTPQAAFTGTATAEVGGSELDPDTSNNTDAVDLEAFEPRILLLPPLGPPGFVTLAVGQDFPPNSEVQLTWDPGLDASTDSLSTQPNGTFSVSVVILHRDQLGEREIRALTDDLPFDVRVDFLVVPRTQAPPEFEGRG